MRSKEHQSEIISGATFTLKNVSRALRHAADEKMASLKHKYRILLNQYTKIEYDELGLKKLKAVLSVEDLEKYRIDNDGKSPSSVLLTDEEIDKLARLEIDFELINAGMRMEIAKARLVKFSIPGEEELKTVDDLFNDAPELFALEVEAKANEDWSLAEAVRKNFGLPTSSAPREDGETTTTTVTSASNNTTITTEDAG